MNLFYGHNLISSAHTKLFIQLFIIGILIVFYDVMLHALFFVVHIAFEWLEFVLDRIVEHLFHTNRQQSQIIVFYLLWFVVVYWGLRVISSFDGFTSVVWQVKKEDEQCMLCF